MGEAGQLDPRGPLLRRSPDDYRNVGGGDHHPGAPPQREPCGDGTSVCGARFAAPALRTRNVEVRKEASLNEYEIYFLYFSVHMAEQYPEFI